MHKPQGQTATTGPVLRFRTFLRGNVRPLGVQGQNVAAPQQGGLAEKATVQPTGKGYGAGGPTAENFPQAVGQGSGFGGSASMTYLYL